MPENEGDHKKAIAELKKRRLYLLQKQAAEKGYALEPHVALEIEDLETELKHLDAMPTIARPSSEGIESPIIKSLPSPLQRYDAFLQRLFEKQAEWKNDPHLFRQAILADLAYATISNNAFIVRHNGEAWETVAAKDDGGVECANNLLTCNYNLQKFLNATAASARETKIVNPYVYTNAMRFELELNCKTCICVIFQKTKPLHALVVYDIATNDVLDIVYIAIINSLLKVTADLSLAVAAPILESAIYNSLKEQFGYVSDYMHERQFTLFCNRLKKMTVHFEPTVALGRMPYIWRWEALARDPNTGSNRAPVDLFKVAELWGRMFQLELDMYFLSTALHAYRKEIYRCSQTVQPGEILPLSVNVYPESLVRRGYRERIAQIDKEQNFPLNKLVLEISEKMPLPTPPIDSTAVDDISWFRDNLTYYTDRGISFAIDDFGVGYASTSRLSRIEPEFVKVDRDAILHHQGRFTLDYAGRLVSNSLGKMKMIVEGFDGNSKFTLKQLYEELRIRYIQGYLLGEAKEHLYQLSVADSTRIAALLEM